MIASLFACSFVSCNDDDDVDPFAEQESALTPVISQYVNNTVIETYKSLADASIQLYEAIDALKEDKTSTKLTAVADAWKVSRIYWERSEAFLYGPVADFYIDPHIDTWPLDEPAFIRLINKDEDIEALDAEDGDVYAADHLGFALLGFHGIEYIVFKDGQTKNVSEITTNELIYALAVAGDLRNQCVRLEASWAGIDQVSDEKKSLIEDRELPIIPTDRIFFYRENMLKAGEPGSSYRTVTDAARAIIAGCITISEEVGEVKIGTAHNAEDVNYIESPYSYNSLVDFVDNIQSIENAYLGGVEGKRGASLSDYIKSIDSELNTKLIDAITNAKAKIAAIPAPFVKNYTSEKVDTAMEACADLTGVLEEVRDALGK
jgi:uncharacterized iron-regulated protein